MKNSYKYFYLILFFVSLLQINCNAEILVTKDYSSMTKTELNKAFVRAIEDNDSLEAENLIQAGADINTPIRYWETIGSGEGCWDYDDYAPAFRYAVIHNRRGIIKMLLRYRKDLSNTLEEALLLASSCGALESAKELLHGGANVNHVCEDKNTPLILAAKKGSLSVVQELIQRGANVNHADRNGNTPLILAIDEGCSEKLIKILLDAGADVTCANKKGKTALIKAVSATRINIVLELLKVHQMHTGSFFGFGTKPINYADEDGNTALIHAVKNIRYSYIVGRNREYQLCVDSQSIVENLFNTPGIDHHHANKKGETAITLFEKLKKDHRMF